MSKRKQVLIGAIVLALAVSSGSFAISYTNATSAMDVTVAGDAVAQIEPAPIEDQPDWEDLISLEEETVILRPYAKGDKTDISYQYPETGQHWDKLDEIDYDGDGTYVYSNSSSWQDDLYYIAGLSHQWGIIDYVRAYAGFRATDTPTRDSAYLKMKTHGTEYDSSSFTVTTDYAPYARTVNTNPNTGNPWTWDEIGSLQIGIGLRRPRFSGTDDTRCTQLFIEVGYRSMKLSGNVPTGDLFTITTHENFTGDLLLKVYLTNTGDLVKACNYLNLKLYLEDSEEAGQTPNYQMLTLQNGFVTFNLKDYEPGPHILSVTGGSYSLVSGDPTEWAEGWTVEPELYCEIY